MSITIFYSIVSLKASVKEKQQKDKRLEMLKSVLFADHLPFQRESKGF